MSGTIPAGATDVLRAWAVYGANLLASRSHRVPNWQPLYRLIAVARQKLAVDAERLKGLLEKSRDTLSPLEEPFDADFDLHRWLRHEREEAYSDWLEWVVRQAQTPSKVFRLFHLGEPPAEITGSLPVTAQRECCIPHGHADHTGRLDLVVRYGDKAIIVVEVKKGDADDADTAKQGGYNSWLAEQTCPKECKYSVLVAGDADHEVYEGFRVVRWSSLCIEMRCLAAELCREKRVTTAAMVLAFVAAVEQNLLCFSSGIVKSICEGQVALFNAAVVDHLKRFADLMETRNGIARETTA